MSSLLLLDCYLWESSRALVDDITAMEAAAFSDWTRCVNFFAQHQCLWWLMRTVKNRLKQLASNGKKTRARFILIRTHTRSPFSFSLFFSKDQTEARRSTPPRPHLQIQHNSRIHEISPFRFSMISNFLVCDMWKETCKKPVCTEVWSLNTFVCLKMPQNSLSVSVNAQLHLTADAGDHFARKLMNSLLGKKKK